MAYIQIELMGETAFASFLGTDLDAALSHVFSLCGELAFDCIYYPVNFSWSI